ncbi:hypothetical protein Vretimale_7712, partial [Volvox reticuliferus]
SKYEEQQMLRSTVALSAVLTADQTGLLGSGNINRGVGANAYSRWFRPDGTSKWKPCVVTAVSEDGTAFVIEWLHIRKSKTVSRFNILFDGESESALTELRNAALEHQRRLQQQLEFNAARDSVPLSAAPLLTDGMVEGIVRRLGLDYWDPPLANVGDGSSTGRGGGSSGDDGGRLTGSDENAAAAAAAGHVTRSSGGNVNGLGDEAGEFGNGDVSGGDDGGGAASEDGGDRWDDESSRPFSRTLSNNSRFSRISRSAASARAQLQGASFRSVQSTTSRGGASTSGNSGGGAANEQDLGSATGNGTASRATSRGSPSRVSSAGPSGAGGGQVTGSKRAAAGPPTPARPALRRRLLQWRYIKRAWRRATTEEPVERIRQRLEEARMEYAIAHNQHVFRVMFARMFGSSGVPDQVEELLMDISRTANTDEDDGGLIFIHRPLLQPGSSSMSLHSVNGPGRSASAAMGPPPSVFVPCPAAFEEPGDVTPPPGVTAYGIMALGELSLMASPPTLRALQQAASYLVNIQTRDIFGLQLLPARHVFAFLAGHDKVAAEHQAYIESCRRPGPTAIIGSPLGASVFEARPFRPDDSIDLITFLNIQEGVRIEELYDIRTRVCQQLAYIIADAADEALQAAVAAAAAAAVAAVERANGKLRTPPGAVPGQAAPWQRQPSPALGSSPSSMGASGGSRLYHLPPTPGAAAAAMVQHAAAQAAFDPVPFFRLTSTLNVELFYSIRMWMLQSLRTYAAALELYGYGGVDTHLYDGVPTEVEQSAAGEMEQSPPPPPFRPGNRNSPRGSGAGAGSDRSKAATPTPVSPHSLGSVFARRVSAFSSDGGGGANDQPSPTDSNRSASGRGHSCAPLFRVTLGVVDGEVQFSPKLDTLCQRLVDSVMLAIEAINTLPGLEISLRQIYREAYPGAAKGAGAAA